MASFSIRPARRPDLPALLALYGQLSARNSADLQPAHLQAWEAVEAQPGLQVLVAEMEGQIVGTVTLALIPNLTRGARPYGVVENVVTHAAYREQGIGRALLAEAERLARAVKAYKVMLQSGASLPEAHAFYRRCGYAGETKRAFEKRWP
ncbi:GNAT family N-acetyltransferase [Deinococcus hopiensis]|uniref:GNAT family N-acetyltransferase n=1 Tax=Deinococcus hopiensis TaxID=309885 RepID=UPI000A063130|nr:GNAT family N-acetyltransferase [Deinococcus hopiensis]